MTYSVRRRAELADFLRTCRDRLAPGDVGLPGGPRRRAPGLRRDEVAELAHVSAGYYTALEQGRDVHVSAEVLASVSRALSMNRAEKRHLFELANHRMDDPPFFEEEAITPALQHMLDGLGTIPAYIHGHRWERLAWNAAASVVMGGTGEGRDERSLILRVFVDPSVRVAVQNWEQVARRSLAQFRASCARYIEDPVLADLVERLKAESREFADWWPEHRVAARVGARLEYNHAIAGYMEFQNTVLEVEDDPRLHLSMYSPMDAATEEKVARLLGAAGAAGQGGQRGAGVAAVVR